MEQINPWPADKCSRMWRQLPGDKAVFRTGLVPELRRAQNQATQYQPWLAEHINCVALRYLCKELQGTNMQRTSCSEPVVCRLLRLKVDLGKRKFWIWQDFPGHIQNRNKVTGQEQQTQLHATLKGSKFRCMGDKCFRVQGGAALKKTLKDEN